MLFQQLTCWDGWSLCAHDDAAGHIEHPSHTIRKVTAYPEMCATTISELDSTQENLDHPGISLVETSDVTVLGNSSL